PAVPETRKQELKERQRYRPIRRRGIVCEEREIVERTDDSGCSDRQDEQEHVHPHAVLELGTPLPMKLSVGRRGRGLIEPSGVHPNDYPMFCRSLPGLKRMVRPGGMRTSFPVRGLRPMPRLRGFTWKTPNPRSSIRSPRCMEVRIASNTASTATSALTLVISAIFETSLTMSTLIMLRVSWKLVTIINS